MIETITKRKVKIEKIKVLLNEKVKTFDFLIPTNASQIIAITITTDK